MHKLEVTLEIQVLAPDPRVPENQKTLAFSRLLAPLLISFQSYEIKSPPWTIFWFRILGIFSVENIARLGVFMFQTSDNSQLCIDSQYSSQ